MVSACIVPGLLWLAAAGCTRSSTLPAPLAAEQIPAEVQKAFTKAAPHIKEVAEQMIASLQKKDYPAAYQDVQFLCNMPGETKQQRLLAARSMLTITGLLQAAQAQGDQQAAAALKVYQSTK